MDVHYYPLKGRYALKDTWPAYAALPSPSIATTERNARTRLDSIDLLRGLVMVVMALDHTRDFFADSGMNPRDVADPALFLTRWITHFCAPIFIFLAGVSAYLYGTRGRSTAEISRFFFTRGFWMIVLEFTVVRMGWTFGVGLDFFVMQVIWAIGASMVVLSALVYLPRTAIAVIGLGMIAGHNLLDGIHAADFVQCRMDLEHLARVDDAQARAGLPAPRALSAHSVGGRHGRGLRAGARVHARARATPPPLFRSRRHDHCGLRRASVL